jgi:predicted  nucleic acid-binding Zn-ribbon protein
MTDIIDLKKELEGFKSQMLEANLSIENLAKQIKDEQDRIRHLKASFAHVIKLINHELVKSFDNNNNLMERLVSK